MNMTKIPYALGICFCNDIIYVVGLLTDDDGNYQNDNGDDEDK